MFELVSSFIVALFATIGIIEVFSVVISLVFPTKIKTNIIITIPLCGHDEKVEFLLRDIITKLKWLNLTGTSKIICIDKGMDSETRRICEFFKKKYEFVEICLLNEFKNFSNLCRLIC
ncbi:MAG: hypothetical protein LBT82_04200 [Oscillospiraceae bacterium]|jgi:hypothetical protein|nr:hypothetical protein [Oscillospiraceae bacterium]